MPVLPTYDYGTVRLFEANGIIEAHFPKNDATTRQVVKGMKGFFDGNRRAWRVTPRIARLETGDIVVAIRQALERTAPEPWMQALPMLTKLAATTRRFHIKLGEGGMRVELPPGHKHEYTLKASVPDAIKDGPTWLVPAASCADKVVKSIINDVILDDRKLLGECIDYLEGFVFTGDLDLSDGEEGALGLIPGATAFADPSFLRAADPTLTAEPLHEYPFKVVSFARDDERARTTLAVMTGNAGWAALRERFAGSASVRTALLDSRHVKGKWSRRRA